MSPTFDEPVHLYAGYACLKAGTYTVNAPWHPPFGQMWSAAPLIPFDLVIPLRTKAGTPVPLSPPQQYMLGDAFLYKNHLDADTMITLARTMTLCLSLFLGVFIYQWSKILFEDTSAILSLFLWAFSPTLLANATLVTTDTSFAVFFFCFFFCWYRFEKEWTERARRICWGILASIFLGLAFGSKYLAISILPIGLLLAGHGVLQHEKRRYCLSLALIASGAFIVLALVFRFGELPIFWRGLTTIARQTQERRATFLLGQYSSTGWWYYFPFLFLTKTPLPQLVFLFWGVFNVLRKKNLEAFLWIPPFLYLLMACFSKVQIGQRHILAIYPFLFVLAGGAVQNWRQWTKGTIGVFSLLLAWQIWTTCSCYPDLLAYFNELTGGPDKAYLVASDSNVDWGQDLKGLGEYIKQSGNPEVILSYTGTAEPQAYGVTYQNLLSRDISSDHINSQNPQKEILAVSVTNLQGVSYPDHALLDWCRSLRPVARIGYSIFVYDVTHNALAHRHLGQLYMRSREMQKAIRECSRVVLLQPQDPSAYYNLGFVNEFFGDKKQARKAYLKALKLGPEARIIKDALKRLNS